MRRRPRGDRNRSLTAEEVVEIYDRAHLETVGASAEVRRYATRSALEEHGYTPLDAIRARYWLRRGKPGNYAWDDPDS